MNNFFTTNELAIYFGVSAKTIYRNLWARGIPAYKVGAQWRIAKSNSKWGTMIRAGHHLTSYPLAFMQSFNLLAIICIAIDLPKTARSGGSNRMS